MANYVSNIVVCYDCNESPENRIIDFTHKLRCPLDNVKSIVVKNVWCIPNKISVSTLESNDVMRICLGASTYYLKLTHGAYHVYEYIDEIQKRLNELNIPITLKIQSRMESCPDKDGRFIWYNDSVLRIICPLTDSTMTIDTLNNNDNNNSPSFFTDLFGLNDNCIYCLHGNGHNNIHNIRSSTMQLKLRYDESQLAFKGSCCLTESATLGDIRIDMPWNKWKFSVIQNNSVPTVTIENSDLASIYVVSDNGRYVLVGPSGTSYIDPMDRVIFVDNIVNPKNTMRYDEKGDIVLIDSSGVVNVVSYDAQSRELQKVDVNKEGKPLDFTTFYMAIETDNNTTGSLVAFFDGAGNWCRAKIQYENHDKAYDMNRDVTSSYMIIPEGIPININIPYMPGVFPMTNLIDISLTVKVCTVDGRNHVKTKESIKEPMGLLLRCPEIESFIWQNRNHANEGIAYFQYHELLNDQRTWSMTDEKSFSAQVPRFDRLTFSFQHIENKDHDNMIQSRRKLLQSVQIRIMLAVCFERPYLDPRTHIGYLNPHIKEDTSARSFDAFGSQEQDAFEQLVLASKRNT